MEINGNNGYMAFKQEASKGVVAGTPNQFLPLSSENMNTNTNFVQQQMIYGGKHATFATLQGQRDHQGDATVLAEPNTTATLFDMLATRSSSTGTNPTTHTYDFTTTNPKSYTVDISLGNIVKRFWGFELSDIAPDIKNNEIHWKIKASALGSFQARTIASISTTTLTLDTTYDPNPTLGLFAGDTVRVYKASDGSVLDTTVASVTNGTTVVLAASAAAFGAGDVIHLRPATPSFSLLPTFLWSNMQWCFAADAATALTAAQTRLEDGSTFDLQHNFKDNGGSKRSGAIDPASLVRVASDASLTVKKYLNTPEDIQRWNDMTKRALVIRMYSGSANQYECRIVFYNLTIDKASGNLTFNDTVFATESPNVNYDQTAGKAVSMTVINTRTTIA